MPLSSSRSRHRILHLSDTHVSATGLDEDGVDGVAALRGLLHDLRHVPDVDLLLITGDVADDGSVAGIRTVRDLVAAEAARRGVPHLWTTGNHDDRTSFAEVLGSGHLAADGQGVTDVVTGPVGSCAAAGTYDGLRVVTLDSLVPGRTEGRLDPDQLAWLGRVLARPAPRGTVLALHHPPVALADHPMRRVVLQDPEGLAAVIRDTDVRTVLCGHLHLQLSGSLAGVPVHVVPGVVTRIDLTAPTSVVRGVRGASAAVVDLDEAGAVLVHLLHARQPDAGSLVYACDADSGEDVPDDGAITGAGGVWEDGPVGGTEYRRPSSTT